MTTDNEKTAEFGRLLTDEELTLMRQRRREGMHLHLIEGNPFDADDIAMFEMFDRERWSHEKRIAYGRPNPPSSRPNAHEN